MPNRVRDLTGQRFGRLVVVRRSGQTLQGAVSWLCQCDCGQQKIVCRNRLLSGGTSSCGCLKDHLHTGIARHNPEYAAYKMMIQRCTNEKNQDYKSYGGRGISVCERWATSFDAFLKDMGPRPEGKSLDRYPNNNGNYEPGNCRWATPKEQASNTRRNHHIPWFDGRILTAEEVANEIGWHSKKLHKRVSSTKRLLAKIVASSVGGINGPSI